MGKSPHELLVFIRFYGLEGGNLLCPSGPLFAQKTTGRHEI